MCVCVCVCVCGASLPISLYIIYFQNVLISGQYFEAAENFELFHKLSQSKDDWASDDGIPFHFKAASHLARIYTTIASQFEADGDLAAYLSYLEKANDMASASKYFMLIYRDILCYMNMFTF